MESEYVCDICEGHSVEYGDDAILVLRGQLHPDTEEGGDLFILEPDSELEIVQLANNQLAIRFVSSANVQIGDSECARPFLEDPDAMRPQDIVNEVMNSEEY